MIVEPSPISIHISLGFKYLPQVTWSYDRQFGTCDQQVSGRPWHSSIWCSYYSSYMKETSIYICCIICKAINTSVNQNVSGSISDFSLHILLIELDLESVPDNILGVLSVWFIEKCLSKEINSKLSWWSCTKPDIISKYPYWLLSDPDQTSGSESDEHGHMLIMPVCWWNAYMCNREF